MSKTSLWRTGMVALAGAALFMIPGTSEGHGRGWGWGPGGYDPWGYHSGGRSVVGSTQPNRQFYPAETSSNSKAAGFVVRLPNANAEVWFEGQETQQQSAVREYVSGNLDPNFTYTFHIRARWLDNGRAVEQSRNLDVRAGQQLVVDFTDQQLPVDFTGAP